MTSALEPTSGSIPRATAPDAYTVRMRRAAANVVWLPHVAIVASVMVAGLLPFKAFKALWWLILALAPII